MSRFERFWNWKKHPGAVWFLAGPLMVFALSVVVLRAILELKLNGDPWYLVIVMVGLGFLVLGLWPIRKEIIKTLTT